jgi:hypothetical protein
MKERKQFIHKQAHETKYLVAKGNWRNVGTRSPPKKTSPKKKEKRKKDTK